MLSRTLTLALSVACAGVVSAQAPFQDARGNSSWFAPGTGGFFQINTGNASASLSYLRDITTHDFWYGIELTGKLNGTSASLFGDDRISANAGLRFSFGKRWVLMNEPKEFGLPEGETLDPTNEAQVRRILGLSSTDALPEGVAKDGAFSGVAAAKFFNSLLNNLTPENSRFLNRGRFDWLAFSIGVNRSDYKLFDASLPLADQISTKEFTGWSADMTYNFMDGGTRLYGVSIGYKRDNNIDDLTEVTIKDETLVNDGDTTRTIVKETKAFRGAFEAVDRIPLKFDAVYWPNDFGGRIGINFFARTDLRDTSNTFTPGIGIFYSAKGAPTRVLGGISFSTLKGKPRIGIVAGFNF